MTRTASMVVLLSAFVWLAPSCGGDDPTAPVDPQASSSSAGGGGMGGQGGAIDPTTICTELGLPMQPFADGPYGTHRGDVAEDFSLPLVDGTSWTLSEQWSGCEVYVFVPDRLPVSDLDPTSVWERDDLGALLDASPRNTHYFFVSRQPVAADATAMTEAMQARIDALLDTLAPADAEHWRRRLHVVAGQGSALTSWVGGVIESHGRIGFSIDRSQRIRGAGYLADVNRYSPLLNQQMLWPWESNLAYAAHEARFHNAQFQRLEHLATQPSTVITLWDGEVLEEFAETTVTLPSASEMAEFDTFEVEIEMQCPDPDQIELGNCGAWDYLAHLSVKDAMDNDVELARFITTYHRESHWVVDVTPMLAHLLQGGSRTFKWSFAPSWNTQPTATKIRLHFSNQGKLAAPRELTFLFGGGAFNDTYNAVFTPVDVAIPADAQKVELWSLITGHGAETANCAEFCNHQHELTVNGSSYRREHPAAGTMDECMPEMENGMTPNQAGTWWFGRGGWCPGQQVEPWVVDVTADVVPGQTATVSYQAFVNGNPPPANAGNIVMSSYLVVYR